MLLACRIIVNAPNSSIFRRNNNRRRVLKKNPLKNPRIMNHLNPYSKVMRKAAQNVEASRKAARQAKLDAKRGVSQCWGT